MAVFLIGLRFLFKGERIWADFLYYIVFFIIGYIMAADPRFTEGFKNTGGYAWHCGSLGLGVSL